VCRPDSRTEELSMMYRKATHEEWSKDSCMTATMAINEKYDRLLGSGHLSTRLFLYGCDMSELDTPDGADVHDLVSDDTVITQLQRGQTGPDGDAGDTWDTGGGCSSGGDAGTWDCPDYNGL